MYVIDKKIRRLSGNDYKRCNTIRIATKQDVVTVVVYLMILTPQGVDVNAQV